MEKCPKCGNNMPQSNYWIDSNGNLHWTCSNCGHKWVTKEDQMKCGHDVYNYELEKRDSIVFIRYRCVKGHLTEWHSMGEEPYADTLEMED